MSVKLRCLNPCGAAHLHTGGEYTVVQTLNGDVLVVSDNGVERWYEPTVLGANRFEVVTQSVPTPAAQVTTDKTNPKEIFGKTKPALGLNPRVALIWMAKALEFGAYGLNALGERVRPKGYGEYNWRETQIRSMVYVHAIERHIADYLDGEDVASDSKVKHLGHIMACAAILLDAEECGTLIDDRPKKGTAAALLERLTHAITTNLRKE